MNIHSLQNSEHKRERKVLPIKELDGGQGAYTLSPFKVTQALGAARMTALGTFRGWLGRWGFLEDFGEETRPQMSLKAELWTQREGCSSRASDGQKDKTDCPESLPSFIHPITPSLVHRVY